ncbi:hypothetical protein [Bdellovibrio sp. BCCA]|uniref:hypothetical protein n=1 Tax=Bdellovibrio sp. BCCA TaxID=3136281 RepID=UPI0030F1D026
MNGTKSSTEYSVSQIKKHKAYTDAKVKCSRNLTGDYAHQVVRYALLGLQAKLGTKAVGLLAREVPGIQDLVVVPQEYIDSAA